MTNPVNDPDQPGPSQGSAGGHQVPPPSAPGGPAPQHAQVPPTASYPGSAGGGPAAELKGPPTGWIGVAAGVLGLLALFLPWFTPKISNHGVSETADSSFHAWNGFLFLILGPLALVVFGVFWLLSVLGRSNPRFAGAANPLRALSLQSIGAGAVAILMFLLSFPIFSATYRVKPPGAKDISWSDAEKQAKNYGSTLSKGPQFGLWLLLIGGLLMIAVGVIGIVVKNQKQNQAQQY